MIIGANAPAAIAYAICIGFGAAAFITSYLKGKPIKEAHKSAVEVSAFVCRQQGAMPKF